MVGRLATGQRYHVMWHSLNSHAVQALGGLFFYASAGHWTTAKSRGTGKLFVERHQRDDCEGVPQILEICLGGEVRTYIDACISFESSLSGVIYR